MSKFSDVDIYIAQLDLILKDYGVKSESNIGIDNSLSFLR